MSCTQCGKEAAYKCVVCEKLVCAEHAGLRTVCPSCSKKTALHYVIAEVKTNEERGKIREFVERFWGEQEQLAFGENFVVAELSAYVAKVKRCFAGFVSFAEANDSIMVVALGILPEYQSVGIGKELIEKVEAEAKKLRKRKLLVATSNDDLPALAFYQKLGFQIYQVKPNTIAKKHGKITKGINGLPVRDELRLQKTLH